jgi:rhamnose utilization protein RhaD (predicted bifunctional aldolase and dehydrogenase)
MTHTSNHESELKALRDLSRRLGCNPLLVQASTGNTSVKIGDFLWIKASGKWLIDACADDFLVSVRLDSALQAFKAQMNVPETAIGSGHGSPSIETAMHAILPYKVVVHVHSVNAIAWAIRRDGPQQLSGRLRDLNWRWIPYRPSGTALAKEIHAAISSCPATNVFVLANHGLVVCGSTCRSAESLLNEVESRLLITPRPKPEPVTHLLKPGAAESDWMLPTFPEVHALATDQVSRQISSEGVLYPCQAMFLPDTVSALNCFPDQRFSRPAPIRLIDGCGVLCNRCATRGQLELLRGLAEVVQRVDPTAPIRYLTAPEISDLLSAPIYRDTPGPSLPGDVCSAPLLQ